MNSALGWGGGGLHRTGIHKVDIFTKNGGHSSFHRVSVRSKPFSGIISSLGRLSGTKEHESGFEPRLIGSRFFENYLLGKGVVGKC